MASALGRVYFEVAASRHRPIVLRSKYGLDEVLAVLEDLLVSIKKRDSMLFHQQLSEIRQFLDSDDKKRLVPEWAGSAIHDVVTKLILSDFADCGLP